MTGDNKIKYLYRYRCKRCYRMVEKGLLPYKRKCKKCHYQILSYYMTNKEAYMALQKW